MTTSPKPTKDEVLKLALDMIDRLQNSIYNIGGEHVTDLHHAIAAADAAESSLVAIREALAQPAADDKAGGEAVALRKFLERMEWSDWHYDLHGDGQAHCPDCGNHKDDGHTKDCELASMLYTRPQPQAAQPAEQCRRELIGPNEYVCDCKPGECPGIKS